MSCDCVNLVNRLTIEANEVNIKIHDTKGQRMRLELDVMKITMELSDDPLTRAKQLHQFAEIKVRMARFEAKIARLTIKRMQLEQELEMATDDARRCATRDLYAEVFAGRQVRIVSMEDLGHIFGGAVNMDDVVDAMRRP